jgi:hypothetical protein
MPISSIVKNFRDGTITIKDGTGTPIAMTVEFEAGDFSITGLNQGNTEATTYLDRGELGTVRKTSRTFPTFSFSAHMTDLSDTTNKTIYDAVNKTAGTPWASAVSTITNSDVYGLDLVISIEGSNFGDPTDHVLTLVGCHLSIDFAEGDPNSFTINGTVYGAITAA